MLKDRDLARGSPWDVEALWSMPDQKYDQKVMIDY